MWTKQEVANKVDHEGGILEAYYWGLRAEDITDLDLRIAWSELALAEDIVEVVRQLLPDVTDEY